MQVLAQAPAQNTADKLYEVERISVKGTRLPKFSVIALSGIKIHDKVNDKLVNAACQRITGTGLVKNVEYAYDAYPDRPGVLLELTVIDEDGLLPAMIKPAAEESTLWLRLKALDPLFTPELPPTEKALAFYSRNLDKCLHSSGRPDEYVTSSVTADAAGKLTGIIFEVKRYQGTPSH